MRVLQAGPKVVRNASQYAISPLQIQLNRTLFEAVAQKGFDATESFMNALRNVIQVKTLEDGTIVTQISDLKGIVRILKKVKRFASSQATYYDRNHGQIMNVLRERTPKGLESTTTVNLPYDCAETTKRLNGKIISKEVIN